MRQPEQFTRDEAYSVYTEAFIKLANLQELIQKRFEATGEPITFQEVQEYRKLRKEYLKACATSHHVYEHHVAHQNKKG